MLGSRLVLARDGRTQHGLVVEELLVEEVKVFVGGCTSLREVDHFKLVFYVVTILQSYR